MLVLLLVTDPARRKRLAAACRDALPAVTCIESDDAIGALFTSGLDRIGLVVLDASSLQRHGSAWLTNWRRMLPHGEVLVLDDGAETDLDRLHRALQRGAPAR